MLLNKSLLSESLKVRAQARGLLQGFLVLGTAEQLVVLEAGEALVLELWRAQAFQGSPRRHGGLGLSHPLHQGAQVTVTPPRIVMDVQLLQVWRVGQERLLLQRFMLRQLMMQSLIICSCENGTVRRPPPLALVLLGIWVNMFPSTVFRRFPLRASWESLGMFLNTSGGRCSRLFFLR